MKRESFGKYNIEDGNFRLKRKANQLQRAAIEEMGVDLYENFYIEEELTGGSTLRIFQNREAVNRVCLMEGEFPEQAPADEAEERDAAEELLKELTGEVALEDFVPCYQNQAIQFAGNDMGSDRSMMIALLYIIIVIMAFVFGITISNTISKEANVIGTLRASGYTQRELIFHYMTIPMLVTAVGAILGNVLGYTIFKEVCVGMYYGSYSLPTYVTIWSAEAFPLSPVLPFFGRFRLRVIFQNLSNYCILLVGILFANLLLMFGMIFPSILAHYHAEVGQNMLSEYQYMLQIPYSAMDEEHKLEILLSMMLFQHEVQTENEEAEEFSVYALNTLEGIYKSEEVLLYGVEPDSRYISPETEVILLEEGEKTVYAKADAQGKVQEVTVETLKKDEEGEEFRHKEGSQEGLPVSVNISYYLDGE